MRKYYFILFLLVFSQFGCENSANTNINASNNLSDKNAENSTGQNSNSNAEKTKPNEEEVPKFDDAEKALAAGKQYLKENQTENAIDALKQATELDKDLPDAHFQLGVAYALKENEDDARVEPNEVNSNSTKKQKKKNSTKSFENAIIAYKKYIRKNPKDAQANYNLGRAYEKLGSDSDKDARKALERAVKLDDQNSLYRTELASVLIDLAKYPEAIKQLNKAIELDSDNIRAEDLLVKAKAGRKRTGFKKKEKK